MKMPVLMRQLSVDWLFSPKPVDPKAPVNVPLENIPGGIKMVCGSIVMAVLIWISLQFGVQYGYMTPIDMQAMSMPLALQSYMNSYTAWDSEDHHRSTRSVKRNQQFAHLPPVQVEDISLAVDFSETHVGRAARLEANLVHSDVYVHQGTPAYGQLIAAKPLPEALIQGRDALVATRAALYLSHRHCQWFGVDDAACGEYVNRFNYSATPLASKCSAVYNVQCPQGAQYRSFDGSCNHLTKSSWGRSQTAYMRLLKPQYSDGIQEPRKGHRNKALPSARSLSVSLISDNNPEDSSRSLATAVWAEFVGNDLAHTPVSHMANTGHSIMCCKPDGYFVAPRHRHPACLPVTVPDNDPFYSAHWQHCMNYVRSLTALRPDCSFGPAEQMNEATHFLDGSAIYGSTVEKASTLRTGSNGQLYSEFKNGHEFLPLVDEPSKQCQVNDDNDTCFQSGDQRVNSHPLLTSMYTAWLREHNRVASKLALLNPHWSDEKLFQEARRIVIAEIQHITYNEWLPIVLGSKHAKKLGVQVRNSGFSNAYEDTMDPTVSNSFAAAVLQFASSMLDDDILLYDEDRVSNVTLHLRDHFNDPSVIQEPGYLDGLLRSLATQSSTRSDLSFSRDLTRMLYKGESEFGLDIVSLSIQQGRDHGLPGYNYYRKMCGLPAAKNFDGFLDVMSKSKVNKLRSAYAHPNDVDLLVGGMAERTLDDGLLGPTFRCILGDQMRRTKKGDRFFYDVPNQPGSLTEAQVNEIKKTSLARIFCDNGDGIETMQENVFLKITSSNKLEPCNMIKKVDLLAWKEMEVRQSIPVANGVKMYFSTSVLLLMLCIQKAAN